LAEKLKREEVCRLDGIAEVQADITSLLETVSGYAEGFGNAV
jgi:hypothetical protein